jgi:hypothetical protein
LHMEMLPVNPWHLPSTAILLLTLLPARSTS